MTVRAIQNKQERVLVCKEPGCNTNDVQKPVVNYGPFVPGSPIIVTVSFRCNNGNHVSVYSLKDAEIITNST